MGKDWDNVVRFVTVNDAVRADSNTSESPQKKEPENSDEIKENKVPSIRMKHLSLRVSLGDTLSGNAVMDLGIGDWQYKEFNNGMVLRSETKGCFALFGTISKYYLEQMDGPSGSLGFPISDIEKSNNYRFALFEHGVILEQIESKEIKVIESNK